jgi:hypothetical protein
MIGCMKMPGGDAMNDILGLDQHGTLQVPCAGNDRILRMDQPNGRAQFRQLARQRGGHFRAPCAARRALLHDVDGRRIPGQRGQRRDIEGMQPEWDHDLHLDLVFEEERAPRDPACMEHSATRDD